MELVPLTTIGPEVYVTNMTTDISNSFVALEETMNHLSIIKLTICLGRNVADLCALILVYDKRLESVESFKPDHLKYIACIFGDICGSKFCLWALQK